MIFLFVYIVSKLIDIFSFLLIVYALMSWFPGAQGTMFYQSFDRLLSPLRKYNFQVGNIDFTIIVLLFLLRIIKNVIYMIV